jgi:hypothetical protein
MTVVPIREDGDDNPGVAGPVAVPRRKGFAIQLLEYFVAWRRREAVRTIRRYDYLMASPSDHYGLAEDESPRPDAALGSDDARLLRSAVVLRDCA